MATQTQSNEIKPLLEVSDLEVAFKSSTGMVPAVRKVNLTVYPGQSVAIVGESGSGKSTAANILLGLLAPDEREESKVIFDGHDVSAMSAKERFALRRQLQVVFQNPYGSLDPMFSVYSVIEEPLVVHGEGNRKERGERVAQLLDLVALPRSAMRRYPNELSGGQRQRVAIARALALRPRVLVLDEAVSALDVLVQNQILHLLNDIQAQMNLSYLFITHDLAVVRQIADDVVVMQKGKVVESGAADDIFARPQMDYTKNLIDSIPGGNLFIGGDIR